MTFQLNIGSSYKVNVSTSINEVDAANWNVLAGDNLYLKSDYLQCTEDSLAAEMQFRYLNITDRDEKLVAIAMCQMLDFISQGEQLIARIANKFNLKIMVCGNMFACGENGFAYHTDLPDEEAYNLLSITLRKLAKSKKNGKTSLILVKELCGNSIEKARPLEQKFEDFSIDVNMVLPLSSNWNCMEDFLSCMVTKYRTKAKQTFNKSVDIEVRRLEANEIADAGDKLNELYNKVAQTANYKLGSLNAQYFEACAKQFKDEFVLQAYYLKNEFIGFSTCFLLPEMVDCNYVGINYDYNRTYALYQRMLYDFVKLGIEKKKKKIQFGRTAELIKSGLGAVPVNMKLYGRHRSSIANMIVRPIISSIKPTEFELRKPFKKEYYENEWTL